MGKAKGHRKKRVGIVLSDRMNKTIVVRLERRVRHPIYGRVIRKWTKFKVHDERNSAKVGDKVRIVETRPLSKEKRWRLLEIVNPVRNKTPKATALPSVRTSNGVKSEGK